MINIYWIDLFCGAGGTSTGIHLAGQKVIACVNHDRNAILAHEANHPAATHFIEDIRDFEVVKKLKVIVSNLRAKDPNALICIWASLECTNFSKAKGGLPRDADSRTLAEHMYMYLEELAPEYFWVENVREFKCWGPLDENGKPLSRNEGEDYMRWLNNIKEMGYDADDRLLNSANYGAYQARERLFIQFPLKGLPISWPQQTHTKDKSDGGLFQMERWKPVREVLDLDDEGKSIFERKKQPAENSLKRILAGLVKFVAKGDKQFIKKYYSGKPEGKVISIKGPAGTVTSVDGQALVNVTYLNTYYGNGGVHDINTTSPTITTKDRVAKIDVKFLLDYQYNTPAHDINDPAPTLLTKDKFAAVNVRFIDQQYGNSKPSSIEVPLNSITQNPKFALVNPQFIMNQYSGGGEFTDIEGPAGSVTGVPKQNLITTTGKTPYLINANSSTCPPQDLNNPSPSITSRTHLLINPSWFGHATGIDEPSVTIIARQDKSPLYLMAIEHGPVAWAVYDEDSETMVRIKMFMVEFGITDIKMRMLKIPELLGDYIPVAAGLI